MKRKKTLIAFVILICTLVVFVYAYKEYYRKPADLSSVKPVAVTDANSLVASYENDEEKANRAYLGNPVDVTGVISDITNQKDTLINIMLGNSDELHRVSCLINGKYIKKVKQLKPGDKVTLRGICTGYLMDVELNRCVLID
jgi:uncharacterized protein YpmB